MSRSIIKVDAVARRKANKLKEEAAQLMKDAGFKLILAGQIMMKANYEQGCWSLCEQANLVALFAKDIESPSAKP